MSQRLWTPTPSRVDRAYLTAFRRAAGAAAGRALDDYAALHAWSVTDPEPFWQTCLRESELPHQGHASRARSDDPMPATRWFEGVSLNYADALL